MVINYDCDFENQPSPNYFEMNKEEKELIVNFNDGYKLIIDERPIHKDNNENIEARLLNSMGEVLLYNWKELKADERGFELYNWVMNLIEKEDKYIIEFKMTKPTGGGVL